MTPLKEIEETIAPYINNGLKTPFFIKLSDGTLKQENYDAYLIQDNIYLSVYKLALEQIALKSNHKEERIFFKEAATSISYEPAKQSSEAHMNNATPSTLNYIDYLLRYCHCDPPKIIASVFPCFYFYHLIADELSPNNTSHPYWRWFDCYTGKIFTSHTNTITTLVNTHFEKTNDKEIYLDIIRKGFKLEVEFHQLECLDA